jgi:hypothetical protein
MQVANPMGGSSALAYFISIKPDAALALSGTSATAPVIAANWKEY